MDRQKCMPSTIIKIGWKYMRGRRQASTSDKCNMIATTYFTHESMNFSFYYNKHIATINEPLLRDVPMDGVYQGYAQCFESKAHNSFVCQSIIL